MIRKSRIHLLIRPSALLLVLVIFYAVYADQQPGERIEKGQYFLRRAPTPEFLVTGVSLNDLSKARFSNMNKITEGLAGQFGRVRTLFDKKSKEQVKITVAVYGSVNEAEDAALELLNSVSAIMKSGSRSAGVIGTHSWYLKSQDGSGTVVFVYDNALFQLFSSVYGLAERSALAIVGDLYKATNGIMLGKKVQTPTISDVIIPETVQKIKGVSLNVKAVDPSQQRLSFVVIASQGQLLDTDVVNEKIYIPSRLGVDELKVYTINEANVVSRVFVKKLTVVDQK